MLRIVVWRLLYHFLCLLKALGYRGSNRIYFAYGANLDPAVLKRRNLFTYSQREILLNGYSLKFNHEIPFKNAAMASIEADPAKAVPGMLYTISKIDELRLDCMESHLIFNRYAKCHIRLPDETLCFFYYSNVPGKNLFPTRVYLDKILAGYSLLSHVPKSFLDDLQNTQTIADFEIKIPPSFLVKNYDMLGPMARSLLIKYDQFCVKLFARLIFKASPLERFF